MSQKKKTLKMPLSGHPACDFLWNMYVIEYSVYFDMTLWHIWPLPSHLFLYHFQLMHKLEFIWHFIN